jgi:hypothetical protein
MQNGCNIVQFFSLALQPQFGPWPTSMKLSVSLRFSRSWTVNRSPLAGDQLVARPLPLHKHRKTHTRTQTLNIHDLGGIRIHDPGFRASEDSICLRPLGYRDRHSIKYSYINSYCYFGTKFRKIFYRIVVSRKICRLKQTVPPPLYVTVKSPSNDTLLLWSVYNILYNPLK